MLKQDTAVRMQTPLGRVRGLGSAKGGTHHWFMQRVTSIALLPLTIWFAICAVSLAGAPYAEVVGWIGRPFNAVLLLALIAASFHHGAGGLQVVIEDYVRPESRRIVLIMLLKGISWLVAVAAMLAVLRIAVGLR
jgi:succinate dehydrogenase / fumarate reductase membrane anchor subunit